MNSQLSQPLCLPERISSPALRALIKTEGLKPQEISYVINLIQREGRRYLARALSIGESIKIARDMSFEIPYLGNHRFKFRSYFKFILGENVGYIGEDDYLGFCLMD